MTELFSAAGAFLRSHGYLYLAAVLAFVVAHWALFGLGVLLAISLANRLFPGHPALASLARKAMSMMAFAPMKGAQSAIFLYVANAFGDNAAGAFFNWLAKYIDLPISWSVASKPPMQSVSSAASAPSSGGFAHLGMLAFLVVASLSFAGAARAQDAQVPDYPMPAAADAIVTYAPLGSGAVFTLGGHVVDRPAVLTTVDDKHALVVAAIDASADTSAAPIPPAATAAPIAPAAPATSAADEAAPAAAPAPQFGGCNGTGYFCWGPQAIASLVRYDFAQRSFSAGFSPGFGYGVSFWTGTNHQLDVAPFLSVSTAALNSASRSSGSLSLIASFAHYLRLGPGVDIVGDHNTVFIVTGFGTNL